jgi:hypothetical protein
VLFHHRTVREHLVALEVSHPEPVGGRRNEGPLDEIRRSDAHRSRHRRPDLSSSGRTGEAETAHEPPDPVATDLDLARRRTRHALRTPYTAECSR